MNIVFHKRAILVIVAVATLSGVAWAAFTPVTFASHEEIFEIPKGTWARRMAGNKVEILPSRVFLTVGWHRAISWTGFPLKSCWHETSKAA